MSSSHAPFHVASSPVNQVVAANRQRNIEQSPILRIIPYDVLIQCFAELDIMDRVRISCVSYACRFVALCPTLWITLNLPTVKTRLDVDMVSVLLNRSSQSPVDLNIERTTLEFMRPLWSYIISHLAHIRTLKISHEVLPSSQLPTVRLSNFLAPVLEDLCVDFLVGLPNAPLLRKVEAGYFAVDQPLQIYPRVTECRVGMRNPRYPLVASQYYRVFPNLTTLCIFSDTSLTVVAPEAPIPDCLTTLRLNYPGLDFAHYLPYYYGHPSLRTIYLHGSQATPFAIGFYSQFRRDNEYLAEFTIRDDSFTLSWDSFSVTVRTEDDSVMELCSDYPELLQELQRSNKLKTRYHLLEDLAIYNVEIPKLDTLEIKCKQGDPEIDWNHPMLVSSKLKLSNLNILEFKFKIEHSGDDIATWVRSTLMSFADAWELGNFETGAERMVPLFMVNDMDVTLKDVDPRIVSRVTFVYNDEKELS